MATLLILAGLAAGGLILSSGGVAPRPEQDGTLNSIYSSWNDDLQLNGISWGTQRAWVQHMVDLNDVWKPRSAPPQEATYSVAQVLSGQANIEAYLQTFGPQWLVRADPQIPIATPDQSQLNVEIPCPGQSFRGDTTNFLASYPRAYADYDCGDPEKNTHIFTGEHGTLGAGEPEEEEELNVPREGHIQRLFNPYGPGGSQQKIINERQEAETYERGTHMDHILGYPRTQIQAGRMW